MGIHLVRQVLGGIIYCIFDICMLMHRNGSQVESFHHMNRRIKGHNIIYLNLYLLNHEVVHD